MEAFIVGFDNKHAQTIRNIRNEVFTKEQNVDSSMDFDGLDDEAIHVLIACNNDFVGTGRMLKDGHIGRLAVLKEYRGQGLGNCIVKALIEEAVKWDLKRVYLGAQKHAIDFYRKLGFSAYGESFNEVNIEHVSMETFI